MSFWNDERVDELKRLWELATVLEAGRGAAGQQNRKDYNYQVDWAQETSQGRGRVSISERPRGSPLDTLVAELMIVANSTWGRRLNDAGIPGLYRVQTGGKVRMSTVAGPHEGLGVDCYAWSSSPLRRYTDLIIQRLLFDELPETANIEAISTACSEKERVSFRAESSVVLLKKLRLAGTYFEADPTRIYPAIVTRIKPFALFFEVPLFDLEGNIHVSKLGNDYFEYNAGKMSFRGSRSGKSYIGGQQIFVRLDRIDYILAQSEWTLVSEPATLPKKKRGK